MRSRATHIEVVDRRAVICPTGNGPQEEKLFKRKLPLKDISLGEAEFTLQVERRKHLFADDDVLDVRRALGNRINDIVGESFSLLIPIAIGEFVWRVLHEAGKNVLPRRR